jgi:hypothetical protein
MLEEGGVPAEQDLTNRAQTSSSSATPPPSRETSPEDPQRKQGRSKERRSRKRSGSGSKRSAQGQGHQRLEDVPTVPAVPLAFRRGSEGLSALEEGARAR